MYGGHLVVTPIHAIVHAIVIGFKHPLEYVR